MEKPFSNEVAEKYLTTKINLYSELLIKIQTKEYRRDDIKTLIETVDGMKYNVPLCCNSKWL